MHRQAVTLYRPGAAVSERGPVQAAELDVVEFLDRFKELVGQGRLQILDKRKKYLDSLARHGLTHDDVIAVLLSLTIADYCHGPEPDRLMPGDVWVFAPDVDGAELPVQFYVKVKIRPDGSEAVCLSFHEAESPMNWFPYRG